MTDEQIFKLWEKSTHRGVLHFARALLSASIADTAGAKPVAWQPIETAPKDGRPVFVWRTHSTRPLTAKWDAIYEDFENLDSGDHVYGITHWMPIPNDPAPPAPSVADAAGARTTLNYDGTVDITCAHCGGNGCFACLRKESGNE